MKGLTTLLIFAVIGVSAHAQYKTQRATIATPDAKCIDCKKIIESVAPQYVDGLVKINVIYQRGITQVTYYAERTNIEVVKAAIATAGFKADDIMPRKEEVAKLPACCRPVADTTQQQPIRH